MYFTNLQDLNDPKQLENLSYTSPMTMQCIITFLKKWHKTGKISVLGKPTHIQHYLRPCVEISFFNENTHTQKVTNTRAYGAAPDKTMKKNPAVEEQFFSWMKRNSTPTH